jgi:hypothetical protein
MNVMAPNPANLMRGGAIILMAIAGMSPGYLDIGNIPKFAPSLPTNFLEHKTSRSGAVIMDRREPTEFAMSFKISADELNIANLRLILNANAAGAFSQSSHTGNTFSIANPVLGATYPIGSAMDMRLTNVSVEVSSVGKTEGVDYALEKDAGLIRILNTGSITNSDTVDITYDRPALAGDSIAPLSNTSVNSGAILIFFRASDGRLHRFVHTIAQLTFSGDIALAGAEFGEASAEVTIMPDFDEDDRFGLWVEVPAA